MYTQVKSPLTDICYFHNKVLRGREGVGRKTQITEGRSNATPPQNFFEKFYLYIGLLC